MTPWSWILILAQWVALGVMGFLLLGTLRSLGRMSWRLDEMEVTRPVRAGRSGLKVGCKAPLFTLPDLHGQDASLADYAGRRVLLVFVQPGCRPCHAVAPELNRLQRDGEVEVVVINNAGADDARQWAQEVEATFQVLHEQGWAVARQYQMFATPFAFLIDGAGVIVSRGVVSSRHYLGFVLEGDGKNAELTRDESENGSTIGSRPSESQTSKEISYA